MLVDIEVGRGGWVRWQTESPLLVGLFRLEDRHGRLAIAELHMADAPERSRDLSAIPLADVSALAGDEEFAAEVRRYLHHAAPLLTVAASWFATGPGNKSRHWVDDMLRCQYRDDTPAAPIAWSEFPGYLKARSSRRQARIEGVADAVLKIPSTRNYPDEFYESVANAYSSLAWRSHKPNALIADANGKPLSTVERWVRRARELGYLPPPDHGRRG
jgi:hypothetical protein